MGGSASFCVVKQRKVEKAKHDKTQLGETDFRLLQMTKAAFHAHHQCKIWPSNSIFFFFFFFTTLSSGSTQFRPWWVRKIKKRIFTFSPKPKIQTSFLQNPKGQRTKHCLKKWQSPTHPTHSFKTCKFCFSCFKKAQGGLV